MQAAIDINWLHLGIGYLLLIIPILGMYYYQTGLIRDTLIAFLRMNIQLILVGLYLEYIFTLNLLWVNVLWVVVMIITAGLTILKRSKLPYTLFLGAVSLAIFMSLMVVYFYFMLLVIQANQAFAAVYFIPLCGMIIGNCLQANVIAMTSYYHGLKKDEVGYRWSLASGASREEALRPFIREALKKSLNPSIATMAVMGLVSLPGMMTGQILGGSLPGIAIKYQIVIMISIFVAMFLTIFLSIKLADYLVFDRYGNLKSGKML